MSAIKIEPVIQEFLPGIPVSMTSVGLSNGCRGIVFGYIKPHTTKEFYVTIKGKKLSKGSRVAFMAYHWYLEPHFESITANKDYVFKGAPNNLNEIFDNKIDESSKAGHMYRMKMKLPTNPYLPEDKADPNDYWIAVFTDF